MGLRENIESKYRVANGIIQDPGKFEQAPSFVAHYYDEALDGREDEWFMDEDQIHTSVYFPTDEEKAQFPDLVGTACVYVWEDEQGFVRHARFSVVPKKLWKVRS